MLVSSTNCTSVVVSALSLLLCCDVQRLRMIKRRICTLKMRRRGIRAYGVIYLQYVGHCYVGLVSVPVTGTTQKSRVAVVRHIFVQRVSQ